MSATTGIRDLIRSVHNTVDRGLRRLVWDLHSPFKVAEHELICRSCKPFESWPCAALRKYEAQRDDSGARSLPQGQTQGQTSMYRHSPTLRSGAASPVPDQPKHSDTRRDTHTDPEN